MSASSSFNSLPGSFGPAGHNSPVSHGINRQHSQHHDDQDPQPKQPAFQQTWQRADLDAVPAPDFCNLPAFEIENLKQQWEGKPVQLPAGLNSGVQSTSNSPAVAAWKKYLLQVSHPPLSARKSCC